MGGIIETDQERNTKPARAGRKRVNDMKNTKTTTNQEPMENIIRTLNKMFDEFNNHYYGGVLPADRKIITTHTRGRKAASGWCSVDPIWTEKEGSERWEINICAEELNSFENVAEVLLHEMAHFFDNVNGINDCNPKTQYHNKAFKRAAEEHGLIVTRTEKNGWAHTELSEEAAEFIKTIDGSAFRTAHMSFGVAAAAKGPSMIKRECLCCGWSCRVTASHDIEGVCWQCGAPM